MEVRPTISAKDEVLYYIRQLNMRAYVKKEHSWFGGAMSVEKNSGFLTICAPRTILSIINSRKYTDTLQDTCNSGRTSWTTLESEISEINYFDFSKDTWFNPMHGFSVAFAAKQKMYRAISRIVGRPSDNIIGYAVTSGYYFNH
ncbi:uncharacterized protein [Temnothorax nylanderi]|uniref:uncharacterized protein isoform X2 n=1 Tax=Temnothorax nylanderi TaxID=102681 RepID=UPI003A847CEF